MEEQRSWRGFGRSGAGIVDTGVGGESACGKGAAVAATVINGKKSFHLRYDVKREEITGRMFGPSPHRGLITYLLCNALTGFLS